MNKKKLRNWKINLGLIQVFLLISVISCFMVCSFVLGYRSGQKVGFDAARARSIANVPRFPITTSFDQEDVSAGQVSEVYEKLKEALPAKQEQKQKQVIKEESEPEPKRTAATPVTTPTILKQVTPAPIPHTPEPVEEGSPFLTENITPGWYAQVSAPRELDAAHKLALTLQQSGFSAVIEKIEVRGSIYFRVLVGREETRERAERLVQQLSRERYLKGEPFARFLK